MTELLAPSPKMKVKLRVGYVWGEKGHDLGPSEYRYTLATALESLRLNGVVTDVHIRTHPKFMDEWVDILVRTVFHIASHFVFDFAFIESMSSLILVVQSISSPLRCSTSSSESFFFCIS